MSTTTNTIRTGLLAILAATVLAGCGAETSPGGSPTATPESSEAVAPSPDSSPWLAAVDPATAGGGFMIDRRPGSEIPWDEVGPGWFLLGYDPERDTPGDEYWDDGWVLGTGETWLLSPEGVAYRGPQPPAGAEEIELWPGADVWFGVPDWEDESHPEQIVGDVVSVGLRSGELGHPWDSETLPQALEVTASGSLIQFESCCDASDVTLLAEDGTGIRVASGDHAGPDLDSLSPDGTAFVWAGLYYQEGEPESSSVWKSDLAGGEVTLATIEKVADGVGWIDETTLLLDTYQRDDDWNRIDREFLALDVTSGAMLPWNGHIEDIEQVAGLSPGTWMWWSSWDAMDAVVTNNDGSMRVALPCGPDDNCWAVVSGNRMLWIEWWEEEQDEYLWRRIAQRVTLVDLETGRQTLVFEGGLPGGVLIDIAPHAKTYN